MALSEISSTVFRGPDSIKNFLNPETHPPTPLVELPPSLNKFYGDGVRILAKRHDMTPLQNVKSIPAWRMLQQKYSDGELSDTHTIVENSSGNTVYSLAILARAFGIMTTQAFVSNEVSPGKLDALRFFGVNAVVNEEPICPNPSDLESGIYKAEMLGTQDGWFNPGQYSNKNNPLAHYHLTGPQLWSQTEGQISLFCAGLGTTGTFYGTSQFLKEMDPRIRTLGVVRAPNNPVPGVRTRGLLHQIDFPWQEVLDYSIESGTTTAYKASLDLCRAGLLVGPSSGFALAGLNEFLSEQKANQYCVLPKNEKGEIICIFMCCDTPWPYMQEYFSVLGSKEFPEIQNNHLLKKDNLALRKMNVQETEPEDVWLLAYSKPSELYSERLDADDEVELNNDCVIFDIRTDREYLDFHLPGAILIDSKADMDGLQDQFGDKKIIVVCKIGNKSAVLVNTLVERGLRATNLKGGLANWSLCNLPRVVNENCKIRRNIPN